MSTACTACAVLDADVIILQFHCGISLKAFLVAILVVRGWVHLQYFTAIALVHNFRPFYGFHIKDVMPCATGMLQPMDGVSWRSG